MYFLKKLIALFLFGLFTLSANAQKKNRLFSGMYIQWGYNTEWYTKSNIRITMPGGTDFTLHKAKAHDRPDLDGIYTKPLEISIPQYNYRIGFYLNPAKTKALELNFDHAKYIVTDGQKVRVTGTIDGKRIDGDSIINADNFLHLEHTDGANWLHLNYVQQQTLLKKKKTDAALVTFIWKAGAGINIPRTDFTWKGDKLNNKFHIAGFNISAEAGVRYYPFKKFFIEATGKTGYVNYLSALSNVTQKSGIRAKHSFGYIELIGTIGYDINF